MRTALGGLLIALTMCLAPPAFAQDYPAHNVTFMVPFAPGGGTDVLARLVGAKLEQKLGKPFIVENRPGAGTTIAASATAKATPDGYTLMQATSGTMVMNPTVFKNLSYTPQKDLVPVSLIAGVPFVLVIHPDLPAKSVAELVALAKKRSAEGKPLTYGSGGVGAFHHLNAELFSSMTGIKMTHVPYKGSVPSMTALIAHEIDVLFVDIGPSIQLIRAGKARALGVTSAQVVAAAPEIQPLAKVGVPGFDTTAWQMIVAPGGTPKPILQKLNATANAAVNEPDLHKKLSDLGMIPLGKQSLTQLDAFIKSETAKWAPVIRNAGLAGTQ
jgi:tripartite-type tricarboxylate transporter receptor subunit TctC